MRMTLLATIMAMLASPVLADEPSPLRYQISPVAEGFVRMDTTTGAMIYCRNADDTIRCAPVAVDPTETSDLRNRIDQLERDLAQSRQNSIPLPTGKDVDSALSAMEALLQRLLDTAKSMEGETTL